MRRMYKDNILARCGDLILNKLFWENTKSVLCTADSVTRVGKITRRLFKNKNEQYERKSVKSFPVTN